MQQTAGCHTCMRPVTVGIQVTGRTPIDQTVITVIRFHAAAEHPRPGGLAEGVLEGRPPITTVRQDPEDWPSST
jgi:hypothetical protein